MATGLSVRPAFQTQLWCDADSVLSSLFKVLVITQLSTKLLNVDGTPASFDTGSRAIMVPQTGEA